MSKLNAHHKPAVLIGILLLALLFALYYYVVLPKKQEEEQLQYSVDQMQSEIVQLQGSIALIQDKNKDIAENTYGLRKKLPPTRMMQELLLGIEEIEYVSDSRVLTINFNNYDTQVMTSTIEDPSAVEVQPESDVVAEEGTAPEEVASDEQQREEVVEVPVSSIAKEALPAELKMVTFNMSLEAPDRKSIESFVKELEQLERVMRIDLINYSLTGESDMLAENPVDLTVATIQVTTFYYEGTE